MRKSLHRPENLILIELLRELRMRENLRQAELADRLGVNQNFVSNVEQGIRRLDVVELRDYASALGSDFSTVTSLWEARLKNAPGERRRKRVQHPTKAAVARSKAPTR